MAFALGALIQRTACMQAKAMSGKAQFPFLVDPNTGKQMLESDAIISYLWNEYGDGQVALLSASSQGCMRGEKWIE